MRSANRNDVNGSALLLAFLWLWPSAYDVYLPNGRALVVGKSAHSRTNAFSPSFEEFARYRVTRSQHLFLAYHMHKRFYLFLHSHTHARMHTGPTCRADSKLSSCRTTVKCYASSARICCRYLLGLPRNSRPLCYLIS